MSARRILGLMVAGVLVSTSITPALADDSEAEVEGLEVEVDRRTVMLGDEVEIEASFERKLDHADDEDDADGDEEADEDEEAGDEDEAGDDHADEDAPAVQPVGSLTTRDGATTEELPTSVTFTVDYGDGSPAQSLVTEDEESDGDEFEAEASGTYLYPAEGAYNVTVTATPDVGSPVSVTVDVTVTTDPVAYARKPELACPEGLTIPGSFTDVAVGATHTEMVECLATRGLVRGRTSDTFSPSANVSRAQMATFLVKLLEDAGVELPHDVDDAFEDDNGNIHEEAINQLAAAGLLTGSADGEVRPNVPLTREQMASLIVRALEDAAGLTLSSQLDYFDDDDRSVHEDAINRAAAAGIATGRSVLEYQPGVRLSRAQLATFLARTLDLLLTEQGAAV